MTSVDSDFSCAGRENAINIIREEFSTIHVKFKEKDTWKINTYE